MNLADSVALSMSPRGRCMAEDHGDCVEAVHLLYHYLDGELTAERRVLIQRHLDDCPPCGQAFDFDGAESSIVSLPVDLNPDVHPQLTMGMWINLDSRANDRGWVIGHAG